MKYPYLYQKTNEDVERNMFSICLYNGVSMDRITKDISVAKNTMQYNGDFRSNFRAIYYDEKTETILLRDGIVAGQGCSILDKIANFLTLYLFSFDVKLTLDHELGHYYPDKLSKSIGNGPWPIFPDNWMSTVF